MVRYRFTSRLSAGVEYDPRLRHTGFMASWIALPETMRRPAVVFGTTSDRIGLPHGHSFHVTASKNLQRETRLPVAPYAGLAYGTYGDRLRPIGGLNIAFTRRLSSIVMYDGVHPHPIVNFSLGRNIISLILVQGRKPGIAYNIAF